MIDTLLTIAFMAGLSIQSPNVKPNPFNYEVSGGVEYSYINHSGEYWGWYERENGEEYIGIDITQKYQPWRYMELSGDVMIRGAQDIEKASVSVAGVVLKFGRVGLSGSWDHWEVEPTAFIGVVSKYLNGRADFYRKGFESATVSAKLDFRLGLRTALVPTAMYSIDRSGSDYYGAKLSLKVTFGGEDG